MYQPNASKQANKKRPLRPMGGMDVGAKHNLEVWLFAPASAAPLAATLLAAAVRSLQGSRAGAEASAGCSL